MTDVQRLAALLDSRPSSAAWQEICPLLEACDPGLLDTLAPKVLSWPAAQREMPDSWWAQWVAGDIRPHHALAGTRGLGRLDSVETGTVGHPVEDDWAEEVCEEDTCEEGTCVDDGFPSDPSGAGAAAGSGHENGGPAAREAAASFYHGVVSVGAPSGLRWLALGGGAPSPHRGGDLVRWETTRDAPLVWYAQGSECHDEAHDLQISPDGSVVVTAIEGSWHAWSAETGAELWRLSPQQTGSADAAGDGSLSLDDLVHFAFSADSGRLAVGTGSSDVVAVVQTRTGAVLLRVPAGQDGFGPVALDAAGQLLAHAGPTGQVVVRDVASGALLASADTGLTSVGALAMAPDGSALFVVGGAVGGVPEAAGLATAARPAARLLTFDPAADRPELTAGELILPGEAPDGVDADSQLAAMSTRAVWTDAGPYAFVGADFGSVLFNGCGQALWADPAAAVAGFTPDGRALVVAQEEITVWFLAGLAPQGARVPPAPPPAPGDVLLSGLPADLTPGGPPPGTAELPCSYWPTLLVAVTDGARGLAFSAKLDRISTERRQVLCRWPGAGAGPGAGPGSGEPLVTLLPSGPEEVTTELSALAFAPQGDVLARALVRDGAHLLLNDVEDGTGRWHYVLPPAVPHGPEGLLLSFSADGSRLVLGSRATGRVAVLDTVSGKPVREFTVPLRSAGPGRDGHSLDRVALDPGGDRVAYGTRDGAGQVRVRDVVSGKVLLDARPAQLRQMTGLAFAPDGGLLGVAGSTHHQDAALWTIPLTGAGPVVTEPRIAVHDLPMNDQPEGTLVWAEAGPLAYFPGSHGAGVIWDAVAGRILADIPFGALSGGVALSPDGRTLVTLTQFGARRWDLARAAR
ncbi:hypothetical protein PJ985_08075 [Streptomyces sp. ACA25]|uniref:WD40 repeat domain-containing protein n=1 Tax=Streptomyces sp. ACA25 TaxID=3022596 RepID=UPI0023080FF9|nr:hypothetical protein [Streptomyces sp. ACA25]MDB1087521.1 hypothetical protein [Streptomyces sp. ACA25]